MAQLRYDRPEFQFPDQLNLVEELLDKAPAKGFGDRPLLRSSRITLSYADVRDRVDRICRVLTEDLGLVPGNRVLLRGGNSIGAGAGLAGRRQGRADRGGHHAAAARARTGRHHRQGAADRGAVRRQAAGRTGAGPREPPGAGHRGRRSMRSNEPGSLDVRAPRKPGGFAPAPRPPTTSP